MIRSATIAAAFGLGGIVASLFYFLAVPHGTDPVAGIAAHPVWVETKWPFLMDEWGEGKAFQCKAADCGVELNLYVRSKIGFCSSTTGVADDNELERLSDFDFMNGATAALGEGHEITVAWMKGRLRTYAAAGPARTRTTAISIVYNNNSDALIATVILNGRQLDGVEPVVIAFLNEKSMLLWLTNKVGL
ncbi:MAG TPA: hypothetical protein VGF53_04595 [Pseudolabrys sp.]|jgi:hypothetical protein